MARLVVVLAMLGVVAVTAVVLTGHSTYRVHVRFEDAGQVVEGARVDVAGRDVGRVASIDLTTDGMADLTLEIDDDSVVPLPATTRATIRAVGQAGVANRRVALIPGVRGDVTISSGGRLPATQSTGIVNLDEILTSFGPRERAAMRRLVAGSADLYAGSTAETFNRMLGRLNPAMAQVSALMSDLGDERMTIASLIDRASALTTAVDDRRPDLVQALGNTRQALTALAGERRDLGVALQQAPGTLRAARTTLAGTSRLVDVARPTLRQLTATAPSLRTFLRSGSAMLRESTPVVRDLAAELPSLTATLKALPRLRAPATAVLRATATALKELRPIARGARFYGTDLILGVFNGLAGIATANYNQGGHYVRVEFVQPPQTLLAGRTAPLLSGQPLLPGIIDLRTGLTRRCPGGNTAPAPDGSSPWTPDPAICDPAQSTPAYVNEPG